MRFKELLIRAIRDDTKQCKMKYPRTIPEMSLIGVQRTEKAVCARTALKGFPEKEAIESGLEKRVGIEGTE